LAAKIEWLLMISAARYILAGSLLASYVGAQDTPSITVSPEKFEFPAQTVGSTSASQTLTLSNPASLSVALHGILVSGIDFSQANDCSEQWPLVRNVQCRSLSNQR